MEGATGLAGLRNLIAGSAGYMSPTRYTPVTCQTGITISPLIHMHLYQRVEPRI